MSMVFYLRPIISLISTAASYMLYALPFAIAFRLIAYGFRRSKGIATSMAHEVTATILAMWIGVLLALTLNFRFLLEYGFSRSIGGLNLVPFREIIAALKWGSYHNVVINLLGNIAMFVPVGILLPLAWKRFGRLWRTGLAGLGLSIFIEITQSFCGRSTDVDDLILNTAGAVVGYGVFAVIRRFWPVLCRNTWGNEKKS